MPNNIADRAEAGEARIYDQDGNLRPFPMRDTPSNRLFAEWLRVHDRAGPAIARSQADG
jgi:hypothetical protein